MLLKVLSIAVEVVIVVKSSLHAVIYLFLPWKKKRNMSLRENLIAILATLITKNFVNLCSEQYVESATNFKNKCEKRHPHKEKSEMSETC